MSEKMDVEKKKKKLSSFGVTKGNRLVVLGGGESGVGTAILGKKKAYNYRNYR